MKLLSTYCPICGEKEKYTVLHNQNFSPKDFNTKIFSARRLPDRIHYRMVKCHNDGLVRSNPIADSGMLGQLYAKSRFNYEEEVANLTKTYLSALLPVLNKFPKTEPVLEVGCGNGFMLDALFQQGFANSYGVEPSRDAIKKSSQNIRGHIVPSILKPGIFPDQKFSCIFMFQTLDHIPKPNELLSICFQLLKPGGYILAFNHDIESLSAKILQEKSPIIDIEHTYLFSQKTLSLLFKKNHFNPIKVYAPKNTVSFRHILWLLPLPVSIKRIFLNNTSTYIHRILNIPFVVNLGNICIIARKD